ncbi:glycosyltransferase family 10 domain-containing protein [Cesiribacter andamanensis]|uniref:glycosyltransferase family 10 domain-containing protein n=1 Tax=Cesiribacter andamanensis TaxID=649507 RepID=UPI00373FCD8C
MPWWVGKDYSYLKSLNYKDVFKTDSISWITSNKRFVPGHDKRLNFLEYLRNRLTFDLYGKGFKSIDTKWDGLVNYEYSIAVENGVFGNYWTEKVADCF